MCEYRLRSCVWEITLECCFCCKYCGSRAGKARENELSTAECLAVAAELAELGCKRVSMIGGEVFLRPDWARIVEALTSRGVRVCIITNGFLFKRELIDELKRVRIESVAVSVDGTERVHDRYRREGSFRSAMAAVDALASGGIPVSIISTLHAENAPLLEEMYGVLKTKRIFAWQLQACSPMGSASESGLDHRFDPRAVIAFVERHSDAPFALGVADNIGYFTEGEGSLRGVRSGNAVFPGCGAGLSSIGIDSAGNVRGCESMYDDAFIEGNLRLRTLKEIWEDENSFSYNRSFTPELLSGACRSCEFGKYCAGGCRSYNDFVNGGEGLYEATRCARNMPGG